MKINMLIEKFIITDSVKDAAALFYNAIYFKGKWKSPFHKSVTEEREFHVTADNKINVPFMEQLLRSIRYGEDDTLGIKWVELKYVRNF